MTTRELIAAALHSNSSAVGSEPLWRVIAYWLVLFSFFSVPLVALLVHLLALRFAWIAPQEPGTFHYLSEFHRIVAGLLAAMLGLNSWDKRTVRQWPGLPGTEAPHGK